MLAPDPVSAEALTSRADACRTNALSVTAENVPALCNAGAMVMTASRRRSRSVDTALTHAGAGRTIQLAEPGEKMPEAGSSSPRLRTTPLSLIESGSMQWILTNRLGQPAWRDVNGVHRALSDLAPPWRVPVESIQAVLDTR